MGGLNLTYRKANTFFFGGVLLLALLIVCWGSGDEEPAFIPLSFGGHEVTLEGKGPGGVLTLVNDKGQSFYLIHVNNQAAPADADGGGAGSFEKPLASLAPAFALAASAARAGHAPVIYIWGGIHTLALPGENRDSAYFAVPDGLIVSGASQPLRLGHKLSLPARSAETPLILLRGLRGSSPDEIRSLYESAFLELPARPGGLNLTLNALTLQGEGQGAAVFAQSPAEEEGAARIRLQNQVSIQNFAVALLASGPGRVDVALESGNRVEGNGHSGIRVERGSILLERGNVVSGNGHAGPGSGLYAGHGRIVLRDGNRVSDNVFGLRVLKGPAEIGRDNHIVQNRLHGIALEGGSALLDSGNNVSNNGGHGIISVMDIQLNSTNRIEFNRGCGLVSAEGLINVGNGNTITENGQAGIAANKTVTVAGNLNTISRNNRNGEPDWHDVTAPKGALQTLGNNNLIPMVDRRP